jgi:hypothetical protein
MKITIDSKYHIWECAAQDDFRPVKHSQQWATLLQKLTCVLIDPAGYAVAADGYIMAIVPATIEDGTGEPVLIPKDVVKKSKGSTMTMKHVTALGEGNQFPNWRKLIPDGMDFSQHGQTGPLDPRLTVRVHEAMGYRKGVQGWRNPSDNSYPWRNPTSDNNYPWYVSQSKTHPTVFFGNGAYAMQMPIYSNPLHGDKEVQSLKSLKDLAQPAQPATSEPIAVAS